MIPKVIHYCWFGGKPLPESAMKCINSWKKYLPGYEIMRWDESNFDVRSVPYVSQAYDAGKYAFVSDYARFCILHAHGGIYFDTDVEVVSPIDDILETGPYMGCEHMLSGDVAVNPGLGMAAEPGMAFLSQMIEKYRRLNFRKEDGSLDMTTIVSYTTDALSAEGFVCDDTLQRCCGFNIYPTEYFCPLDYRTGKLTMTRNTRTIHHYAATWHTWKDKWIRFKRIFFTESQIRKISAFLNRFRKKH